MHRRIIATSDWHVPYQDKRAMKKFEEKLDDFYTDYVVLGDVVDFDAISKYSQGKPAIMSRSIADQTNEASELLSRHASILQRNNKNIRLYFISGNHERRLDDFIDHNPALSGLVTIHDLLRLSTLGYSFYKYGDLLKIGQVTFSHGIYCGQTHAKRSAAATNGFIVYGHTHSIESNTVAGFGGAKSRAFSIGCLAQLRQDYLKGKPTNWEHGYAEILIDKKTDVLLRRL